MNRRSFVICGTALAALPLFPAASCNETWMTVVLEDLPSIEQVLDVIATIVTAGTGTIGLDPAVIQGIHIGCQAATAGLVTVKALVADYNANPTADTEQKIIIAIRDVEANLHQILAASQIKNPQMLSVITTGVSLALNTVMFVLEKINAKHGIKKLGPPTKLLKKNDIKNTFNSVLSVNGYDNHKI